MTVGTRAGLSGQGGQINFWTGKSRQASVGATMRNFDALYADRHVAARGLPGPAAIAAQDGEFRGLLLNRADLADTPPAEKPPVKIVCCDVLRVPRTMVLELAGPGVRDRRRGRGRPGEGEDGGRGGQKVGVRGWRSH